MDIYCCHFLLSLKDTFSHLVAGQTPLAVLFAVTGRAAAASWIASAGFFASAVVSRLLTGPSEEAKNVLKHLSVCS